MGIAIAVGRVVVIIVVVVVTVAWEAKAEEREVAVMTMMAMPPIVIAAVERVHSIHPAAHHWAIHHWPVHSHSPMHTRNEHWARGICHAPDAQHHDPGDCCRRCQGK